jgi:hypothetical protein
MTIKSTCPSLVGISRSLTNTLAVPVHFTVPLSSCVSSATRVSVALVSGGSASCDPGSRLALTIWFSRALTNGPPTPRRR